MKSITSAFLFVAILSLAIALPSLSTATPQGESLVVNSAADSGPGTLRGRRTWGFGSSGSIATPKASPRELVTLTRRPPRLACI